MLRSSETPVKMAVTRSKVVVFGSLNMDLVVRVPRMPQSGETLTGRGFLSNPGGKGANQAVACARQGGRVEMVGRVGDDGFGAELRAAIGGQGVDASGVVTAFDVGTGVAMIMVDDAAHNCIAVVPGANGHVGVQDAQGLTGRLVDAGLLLLQLEIPMAAVLQAATAARQAGCRVLLNPAPAQALPIALWSLIDILVLNETEAALLTQLPSVDADNAGDASTRLLARGPDHVILTLGGQGLVWASAAGARRFESVKVQALDTTAAGDTFIGALAALLVESRPMEQALVHAIRAAAICVTRAGAQASMPSRAEVERLA
jgi:ribokinase